VVVTGGTGFVGSHLIRRLVGLGCAVTLLARPDSNLSRLDDVTHALTIRSWDLNDRDTSALHEALTGTEIIFHLAAAGVRAGDEPSTALFEHNVIGTHSLLQLARRLQVDRFVYCGSCFEYGSGEFLQEDAVLAPVCEYGVSKASGTMLANAFHRKYGLRTVCLRPFLVYGPFEHAKQRFRLCPGRR